MDKIERTAFFVDKRDLLQKAEIIIDDLSIDISTHNQAGDETGFARVFIHPNNRLYLDVIYCYDRYRSSGVGSAISELIDYLVRDKEGWVIRGVYDPKQLSFDCINGIDRSQLELDLRAKAFYKSAGYEIVDYNDFKYDYALYPYLTDADFVLGEEEPGVIVAKPVVEKEHTFFEEDGTIFHIDHRVNDKRCFYQETLPGSKYVKVTIGDKETFKPRGEKYELPDGRIATAGSSVIEKPQGKRKSFLDLFKANRRVD